MLRQYAQVVGVILLVIGVLGIVGLFLGWWSLFGFINIDIVEDIVHLVTGGLLAYVGFGRTPAATARSIVGGLGVVFLVVGVLGFLSPMLFGLIPHSYSVLENFVHLVIGVLSMAVAWYLPRRQGAAYAGRA